MEPPSLSLLWATTTATTTPSANNRNLEEVTGALIRRLGLATNPKQARGALGRKLTLNAPNQAR